MKQILSLLILVASTTLASATVYTVNNNNPTPGQYTTLAAAQTVASPGDTLLIAGSPYSYNDFTISKRLTIIGTGHHPLGDFPASSTLNKIDFSTAVTATTLYDVNIIGLDVNVIDFSLSGTHRAYVSRCRIRSYLFLSTSQDSILIEGNLFTSSGSNVVVYTSASFNSITFKNNVFNGAVYNFYPNSGGLNLYFDNNLFLINGYVFAGVNKWLQFRNNIFYRGDPSNNSGNVTNTSFNNNILYKSYSSTTSFPSTSGNTSTGNISADPKFVSFPSNGDYFSYTYDFHLQSTSPGVNAGTDGKDIGLTGGSGYFNTYGIPNIPQINQFDITSPSNATVLPGGTLQISIQATIAR